MKKIPSEKLHSLTSEPLVDSHIHLDSEAYLDDWQEVWQRAQVHSVRALVLPSTDLASSRRIAELCNRATGMFACVGIHPHQAAEFDPVSSPAALIELLPNAKAIGETGLEAHYDFCPWDLQLTCLRYHLNLARDCALPLILHCRQAEQALYDELRNLGPFPAGGVVHCYTGTWEIAQRFLELGFHLGLNGILTLANATQTHEVARRAPMERLLLETDGPYLAPKPFRGFRNEPALIAVVARCLAELRQSEIGLIARSTTRNSQALFRLPLEVCM